MTATATATAPQGDVADRYRLLEQLGEGGMGTVYRAVDARDGREVALKRLRHDERRGQVTLELFEREFHSLSELAHPRIIEVYDYGVDERGAYYTMELLGGQDLRAMGRLPWQQACPLLRDVASSLSILHARRLVHCDITPRNVRCTADGRAKLLDFGGMAPMGPPRRIVGTPPFVSPEMVQLQSLDGRSDLFSFGALAYWVLTGRYAYPARNFGQLRALWTSPLRPPHALDPEIPRGLSDLVMDCMAINASARPRSAAVVMERLCGIASLPLEEQQDVAAAYLTTPRLVGREAPLALVREALLPSRRAQGAVFSVRGAPGSGRTRFLEACMLEGKLQGAHVVRAGPGEPGQGDFGALRSICDQVFELAPEAAARAVRVHGPLLAHLIGGERAQVEPSAKLPARRHLLAAARDFLLAATRGVRVLISVDDAAQVDEGSASVLMLLAQKAHRRSLWLLLALAEDPAADGPFALLAEEGVRLTLPLLDEALTEQLIDSLFGGAAHSLTLARRIHAVAGGNPRATMQLATRLVDQGVVRYEAGSFLLPEHLSEADLPSSLDAAARDQLAQLPPDALELLRALALTEPAELSPARYARLAPHGERGRIFRALDQLLAANLLTPLGDRYRLADATLREIAVADLPPARRRELHARLAAAFEEDGTITRRGFHLMEAGEQEAAIRVLLAKYIADPAEPRDPLEDYVPGLLDLLERATVAAQELPLPPELKVELAMKTCGASQFLADLERFKRIAPPLREQLERWSGLRDFDDVDPTLEPMQQLTVALTAVQQRFDATPEAERGLAPVDAVRELSRMCAMYSGIAVAAQDTELLADRPCLTPLSPLSPAIECIERFADAATWVMQGRSQRAAEALRALIERLMEPDLGGLGTLYHRSMLLGARYIVGLIEAASGMPDAGDTVRSLEQEDGHRVNAQRVHQICHMMQGRPEEAKAAARRAELAILQDGHPQRYFGTTARSELAVHAMLDELMEVKRLAGRLGAAVPRFPGWRVAHHIGRFHYLRIQGDAEGAMRELSPALSMAKPVEHRDWTMVASAQVQGLCGIGRAEEAAAIGLAHMRTCTEQELHPGHRSVVQATAAAMLQSGQLERAAELIEALVEEMRADGVRGLLLGSAHELAARVAIARGDSDGFERHRDACLLGYRPDGHAPLLRRHQQLYEAARQAGIHADGAELAGATTRHTQATMASTQVLSRMLECSTPAARASCALQILAELVGPRAAYLFGVREGQLAQLAAMPGGIAPPLIQEAVSEHMRAEAEVGSDTTMSVAATEVVAELASQPEPVPVPVPDAAQRSGERVRVLSLISTRDGSTMLAAFVAFVVDGEHEMPAPEVLRALADVLLDSDDVDPVTRIA